MKNLKIWQKLLLLGAVFLVPFAIVTYKMASSIDTLGADVARQEMRGQNTICLSCFTPEVQLHGTATWL